MLQSDFLTVIFSAKEALFKATFPRLNKISEFLDAQLTGFEKTSLSMVFHGDYYTVHWQLGALRARTLVSLPE